MTNLYRPEWDVETDREPYRWKRSRVGLRAGARELGASLFEVPPGASTFPLHAHHNNEELVVVLAGRPTLRTLEGERQLEEGEVVACPMGREGAHRLENRTDEPVRVLIVSTMRAPDVNEFPDSGLLWARTFVPGRTPGEGDVEFSGPAGPTDPLSLP